MSEEIIITNDLKKIRKRRNKEMEDGEWKKEKLIRKKRVGRGKMKMYT